MGTKHERPHGLDHEAGETGSALAIQPFVARGGANSSLVALPDNSSLIVHHSSLAIALLSHQAPHRLRSDGYAEDFAVNLRTPDC